LIDLALNKKGVPLGTKELVGNIVTIAAISGIIGARLFSILEYPEDFLKNPFKTIFSTSGFTFYGGLIFGSIAVLLYAKKINLKTVHLLDSVAPALMISYAIGRIGCHLSGDGDWGIDNLAPKPSWMYAFPDWLWSYNYPHNVIKEGVKIFGCDGEYCTILQNPVFPTPLYEIIVCTFLFIILWVFRKRIKISGVLFSLYLILNGLERFFIEKIRIDSEFKLMGFWMKQAELIALTLIFVGFFLIILLVINFKKHGIRTENSFKRWQSHQTNIEHTPFF
jgi:prolipoprotein diacylglyceryl transferase